MKPSSFRSAANVRVSAQSSTQVRSSSHQNFRLCQKSVWLQVAQERGRTHATDKQLQKHAQRGDSRMLRAACR